MYDRSTQNKVTELRGLLIAPKTTHNQPIDTTIEISAMTSLDRVKIEVENGHMSRTKLFERVRNRRYDILHFAAHSDENYLYLNGDKLPPDQIWQVAQMVKARLVFFNSCRSGRLASVIVSRGVEYAIHSNVEMLDSEAWQAIVAFYETLDSQIEAEDVYDIHKAFDDSVAGDGNYGIYIRYDHAGVLPMQRRVERLEKMALGMLALGAVHLAVTASFLAAWWNGGL
jgi:hypothetical protein